MKEMKEGSALWEKVAAGFLAIFAIREGGKVISTIISWIFLFILFGCAALYFIFN